LKHWKFVSRKPGDKAQIVLLEVFMSAEVWVTIFWDVMPCGFINGHQSLRANPLPLY
jgi:hypothetical protein